MSVNSIGSNVSSFAPAVRPQAEAVEAQRVAKNDNAKDDAAAEVKASAPKPTVNLDGQSVGTLISTSA